MVLAKTAIPVRCRRKAHNKNLDGHCEGIEVCDAGVHAGSVNRVTHREEEEQPHSRDNVGEIVAHDQRAVTPHSRYNIDVEICSRDTRCQLRNY